MRRGISKYVYSFLGIVILLVMMFPVYWTIVSSLETQQQITAIPPTFLPPTPSLEAYKAALSTQGPHIVTSFIVACGTVVLSLVVAAPAAYALAHFRFRITAGVVFGLLITQMVPSVILANSLFVIFTKLNLINSYWGLILADASSSIPFDILIVRSFMLSIPYELVEAALVDGANEWKTFIKVILPVSRSAVITAGLFSFLFAWGDFLFALTMMTNNSIQPITLSLYSFIGQYSQSWNDMMASAVLASIPAAILLVLSQRYIAAGLTSGSVKG